MSAQDILGQDEIDALMSQAQQGAGKSEPAPEPVGGPVGYDFRRSARIVRGRAA